MLGPWIVWATIDGCKVWVVTETRPGEYGIREELPVKAHGWTCTLTMEHGAKTLAELAKTAFYVGDEAGGRLAVERIESLRRLAT